MNYREAYERAVKAVSDATNETDESGNFIIQGMSTDEIETHIASYIAYAFKQGPHPKGGQQ